MKRLLLSISLILLLLLALFAAGFWFILGRSLPTLDGEVTVTGLAAEVTIDRDDLGVPTITAANRVDLAYGTGFVHAQDRFFQMDLSRRNAAGELSQLFGAVALPLDRARRLHRFRARANSVLASLPAEARTVLDAYVKGVNAGLKSNGGKSFEYFLIGSAPEPWRPADTLLIVYSMYLELNDELADRDIRRGLAAKVLPQTVFAWLYPEGTAWDAALSGEPGAATPVPAPSVYRLDDQPALAYRSQPHAAGDDSLPGSNSWAVSGKLTVSGRAIVANDMHLSLSVPNVFYRARLQTRGESGISLNGVTLPGAPVLIAGSNGHVAWSNTNSYGDWTDAVVIRPGERGDTYLTPEGPREFEIFRENILVKDASPVELVIRETVWGPVREDSPDPERLIAVAWIAHHREGVSLGHLALETVRDVSAAIRVANTIGMPPQNFVVGDAAGNIAWTIAGRIPLRASFEPGLPADWSTAGGWRGWLAIDDYPRVVNPESGRIWTANARVVDGDALRVIGDGGYDMGARAKQIKDRLYEKERWQAVDMLAVQLDDEALFLARWRELLLGILDEEAVASYPARAVFRDLCSNWIPRAAIDSVGYRLVRDFRLEVRDRVFAMLMQPVIARYGDRQPLRMSNQFEGPLWQLVNEQPPHLLTANYESWRALLLEAVDANLDFYTQNYGDDIRDRTWGERNTMAIRHPLSSSLPLLSRWLDMPAMPLSGDANMPRVLGPSFGASERFAVSAGDESAGYLHMPAGQSGHPMSTFYRKGHDDWAEGRPAAFLPGITRHTLLLRAVN